MKFNFKSWIPHLIALAIFLTISVLYCKPALNDMQVAQHDLIQWRGMAQDAFLYKDKHGVYPEWTNGLFAGMPSYNIAFNTNAFVPALIIKFMSLGLPEPISYFFLACVCFYFLSQVLRVNPWIGILGSIGFAFCSYDPIIIAVGHHTKMITMALMPALLGALILVYEKRYWLGAGLLAAFTAAFIVNNHLQVIYYMLLVVLAVTVYYIIGWVKAGKTQEMVKAGSIALVAALIGALTCSVNLFTTYDYSKESMRGGQANLLPSTDSSQGAATKGLDADYAFKNWSYGRGETLSLLVPNIRGGASESLGEQSKFYEALMAVYQSGQIDQETAQQLSRFGSAYWGDQLFTSGPVYVGAVIVLLFVLGMFAKDNKHRWWAFTVIAISILMAWGYHFKAMNEFLLHHLPFYNKFRAPSMMLILPQLLMPMVGMLGLQSLFFGSLSSQEKMNQVKNAGYVTAGLLLAALMVYFTADFLSATDASMLKQLKQAGGKMAEVAQTIANAAIEDRKKLLLDDWLRSSFLVLAGFGLLFFFVRNKIGLSFALGGLLLLSSIDLLAIGRRYLNDENYQAKDETTPDGQMAIQNKPLYDVLTQIQQDKDPQYRVFNLTGDAFNDALTSYFVRSIGGYHPAKLSIYQDLIQHQLGVSQPNLGVLNMLNTRYVIIPTAQGPQAQRNSEAYGPAWLAKTLVPVQNAAAEMEGIGKTYNLKDTAFVQNSFMSQVPAPQYDSSAFIRLNNFDNDAIEYLVNAPKPQFAVLSEIYYSRGWNAYADDKKTPIVKTNYVLRGVPIPAGTKKLLLKFEPQSYKWGRLLTGICSILVLLFVAIAFYIEIKGKKTPTVN